MHSKKTSLDNGLRILTCERPETETVSLGIWVNTGSAYETKDINGISHFLEHMSFKGTKTRTSLQLSEEIEGVGGQSNAYTSREFTAFYAKMLKDDAELATDILTDTLNNSTFPEEELVKEREVVVQEIKQSIDAPDDIIYDYFQEQAFPDQSLGRTILGPIETVRSFTRETLQNYLDTHYAAENMIACAVGNIKHEDFVRMIKERMGNFREKKNFETPSQIYRGGFYAETRDIEQAHIMLGFNGFKYYDEHYYPNIIFSTIFGGGTTSRLFQEIREKRGLVYTVYSFTTSHTENGLCGIYAGTGPDELKTVVPVITDEIKRICNEMVTEKELQRAKIQLKASILMSLESSSSTAEIIARQMLLFGRIIPTDEMVERINNVTREDVLSVAQKVFSTNPIYCLVGAVDNRVDYDELKQLLKA